MKVLLIAYALGSAVAQTPDVQQIMHRVAMNQAQAQDLRSSFVYRQKQAVRLHRGNGKMAREEQREYIVTPEPRGVKKELVHFEGRYLHHGKPVAYDRPGTEHDGIDIDADVVDSFFDEDHGSRDGIASHLFPLTYHQQLQYQFRLVGTETFRGAPVYRIAFEGPFWKGEALIDASEYQPVLVTTKMAHGLPLLVTTALGTNLKGLGFTVSYRKFGEGVWFPVSYGGEFELRAVFLYKRTISISLVNSDFQRVDVSSSITYPDIGQ